MGKKRYKIAKGPGPILPISVNFSSLERELEEDSIPFDPSDGGLEEKRLENNLAFEEMIIQLLCNLELREKLIFIFQLLRDNGYQIDHGSFAKTISLSRRQYMRILKDVRLKSSLFIKGYKTIKNSHKDD